MNIKYIGTMTGMQAKLRLTVFWTLKIIGHVILFFASICFWSNKITIFCLSFHDYRCLNLDPQNIECLKVFNNFVYVFWRAEGFGCMWATEIKGMLMYAKVL